MKKQTTLFEGDEKDLALSMPLCEHDLRRPKKKDGLIITCYACLICMRNVAWSERSCFAVGICPIRTSDIEAETFRNRAAVFRAREVWKDQLNNRREELREEVLKRRKELEELKESYRANM